MYDVGGVRVLVTHSGFLASTFLYSVAASNWWLHASLDGLGHFLGHVGCGVSTDSGSMQGSACTGNDALQDR